MSLIKWIYKHKWGKKFLFIFLGKRKDKKSEWPAWVTKTDEERIQNIPWILEDKSEWIATEKIDGTSTTATLKRTGRKNTYLMFVPEMWYLISRIKSCITILMCTLKWQKNITLKKY